MERIKWWQENVQCHVLDIAILNFRLNEIGSTVCVAEVGREAPLGVVAVRNLDLQKMLKCSSLLYSCLAICQLYKMARDKVMWRDADSNLSCGHAWRNDEHFEIVMHLPAVRHSWSHIVNYRASCLKKEACQFLERLCPLGERCGVSLKCTLSCHFSEGISRWESADVK